MRKKSLLHKSFFCILLFSCISHVAGENWTRFRGPNGQGHSSEKNLPVKWTENEYLWTVKLPGMGHSSPVIWGDKVFITCATKDNGNASLIAYHTTDGKELWKKQYEFEPVKMNELNSIAASTPTVDEKHVYSLWYGKDKTLLVALDHTGRQIWSEDFGVTSMQHGPCSSPILYKDLVIFTQEQNSNSKNPESKWVAVNKQTGQLRWTVNRGLTKQASYSVPCVYTDKQGKDVLIFSSRQHGITAVDPATGELVWETKDILPARVVSSPVIAGDLILNTCGSGGGGEQLAVVRAPQTAEQKPQVAYTSRERFIPYVSTGIGVNNLFFLYHDQGMVTCLDSTTGNIKWSEKPAGRYYSSPVYANDTLYCIDMDGKFVVLKAEDSYEILGIMDLGEETQASVSIADGRIFLRTLTRLVCVGKKR
ncbi:PQQ-binding-like beta-propeller repeat protein [Planctomycetota bacterium]